MVFLAKDMSFKDNNDGKKESKLSITIFKVEAWKIKSLSFSPHS